MKLTKIGLLTLGLISITYADTCIHGNLNLLKESTFSPKIEIYNNLTTIIPENDTVVEERRETCDTKVKNVTDYLLPKIYKGKITINDSTKIDFCGEETYLVAIGINQYQNLGIELQQAINDTKKITKKVIESCANTHTRLLSNQTATKKNILKVLNDIQSKVTSKDSIIFFYSGNGFNLKNKNYVITYDSKMTKKIPLINSFLSQDEVSSIFKKSRAKKGLMIFDACTTALSSDR